MNKSKRQNTRETASEEMLIVVPYSYLWSIKELKSAKETNPKQFQTVLR